MSSRRKFLSTAEASVVSKQPTKPCSDCPFLRDAVPGWLGGSTPKRYLEIAHSDTIVDCHALKMVEGLGPQCAGLAIYRSNVCKRVRQAPGGRVPLVLAADRQLVFSIPTEFIQHHAAGLLSATKEESETAMAGVKKPKCAFAESPSMFSCNGVAPQLVRGTKKTDPTFYCCLGCMAYLRRMGVKVVSVTPTREKNAYTTSKKSGHSKKAAKSVASKKDGKGNKSSKRGVTV